jgi:CBS domain containing-hemolysin-like protein
MVRLVLKLTAPIAVPIGRLLDRLVGEEESGHYSKAELRALLRLHQTETHLTPQQSRTMEGAMDLVTTEVARAMTPRGRMFMLSSATILDEDTLATILGQGFSRIPVYEEGFPEHILGTLLAMTLVVINPQDRRMVGSLGLRQMPVVDPKTPMHELLELNAPFYLVSDSPVSFKNSIKVGHSRPEYYGAKLLGCVSSKDIMFCLTKKGACHIWRMQN